MECGGLRLACTPEREQELDRQVAWARTFGLPLERISAGEAGELFPLMVTDGVRAASYLATDGYLDPSQLTYALADGARAAAGHGSSPTPECTGSMCATAACAACGPSGATSRPRSSSTPAACTRREIGRMAGVRVPVVPFAHEYLVTQPFRERGGEHLPTLRDPDNLIYYREEGGGLVMGGYERPAPRGPR